MGDPQDHDVVLPEEQTMGYYWTARAADMRSPIQHPHVPANNFEVSTSVITMMRGSVVFRGKEGECPRSHLRQFHELIDGIKINRVSANAIQLRYFPFTLEGRAKEWPDAVTTTTLSAQTGACFSTASIAAVLATWCTSISRSTGRSHVGTEGYSDYLGEH
ncbi:unnamed protein product [Linum trigynum]|uniref:Peptidase C1A papain C-terminal domain-containing protein n=1 Tax=Linum trigynum TaxID=586398 RepID=A0AAV2FYN8_9ROSI